MSSVAPARPSQSASATALKREEQRETAKTLNPTYTEGPGRRHFWYRRVHSLAGLVFGAYITIHLLVNATGFWPKVYQQNVDKIHSLEPMLPLIEVVTIFIPLLIHAIYGAYIGMAGIKFNTMKYNYGGNVRYSLQRWSSYVLLAFVAYHIATLHKWGLAVFGVNGFPQFNPQNVAYQSTARAIRMPYASGALNWAVIVFYLLGTWSAVFHWANGLWTAAIAWGLTITRSAQRRWGHVCLGFGIIMFLIGTGAWASFGLLGNPGLSVSATQTLPAEISRQVHGQATGGEKTNAPEPANVVPGSGSSSQGAGQGAPNP